MKERKRLTGKRVIRRLVARPGTNSQEYRGDECVSETETLNVFEGGVKNLLKVTFKRGQVIVVVVHLGSTQSSRWVKQINFLSFESYDFPVLCQG